MNFLLDKLQTNVPASRTIMRRSHSDKAQGKQTGKERKRRAARDIRARAGSGKSTLPEGMSQLDDAKIPN